VFRLRDVWSLAYVYPAVSQHPIRKGRDERHPHTCTSSFSRVVTALITVTRYLHIRGMSVLWYGLQRSTTPPLSHTASIHKQPTWMSWGCGSLSLDTGQSSHGGLIRRDTTDLPLGYHLRFTRIFSTV
jgi:hypothetical protein